MDEYGYFSIFFFVACVQHRTCTNAKINTLNKYGLEYLPQKSALILKRSSNFIRRECEVLAHITSRS
jgi:hypothetical protein